MRVFKKSAKDEEREVLQLADLEAHEARIKALIEACQSNCSLHKRLPAVQKMISEEMSRCVGLLKANEYKWYNKYVKPLEKFVLTMIEQSLREWIQLGERELKRPKIAELIASLEIGVDERLTVKLGKYIKDVHSLDVEENANLSFVNFLVANLCILNSNANSITFVKERPIDALAGYLKSLEIMDIAGCNTVLLLTLKSIAFNNTSLVLIDINKLGDGLSFAHNGALLFERLRQMTLTQFDEELISYAVSNSFRLRHSSEYFDDSADFRISGDPIKRYHADLYRDLSSILTKLGLHDEADEALKQIEGIQDSKGFDKNDEYDIIQKKFDRTMAVLPEPPKIDHTTPEQAAMTFTHADLYKARSAVDDDGGAPLLAVDQQSLLMAVDCDVDGSSCRAAVYDCRKDKCLLVTVSGINTDLLKQAILRYADIKPLSADIVVEEKQKIDAKSTILLHR